MKTGTLQALTCLGLGATFGFIAASRGVGPTTRADGAAAAVRPAEADAGSSAAGVDPRCCSDGAAKGIMLARAGAEGAGAERAAPTASKKPNVVFIMGDDIGWFNIGAYHQGMMAGRTPNLDKLAAQGMRFTDYYAEASCTAGRAAFITGELPIRTGLTTVGQAGAKIGLPAEACTIATALKEQGYATGQFGKNHLGDLNEFLPTVHGFDEFFGYLYHLDAMEDPAHRGYPQELLNRVGPRNMVHSWARDDDDATVMPRWGKVGKQKIEDAGDALSRSGWKPWTTRSSTSRINFIDKVRAKRASRSSSGSTRRACTSSRTFRRSMRSDAQLEQRLVAPRSRHGPARRHSSVRHDAEVLKDIGVDGRDTIVVFTTDNGTENFTWPDGGQTPFAGGRRGRPYEGGFRVPMILRWPGQGAGRQPSRTASSPDWTGCRHSSAAAGNPNIMDELLKGKTTR